MKAGYQINQNLFIKSLFTVKKAIIQSKSFLDTRRIFMDTILVPNLMCKKFK